MRYLLDTVTIVRHFCDSGKMGTEASRILEEQNSSDHFYVSVISLMEILYLSEKNRIPISLDETIKMLSLSNIYSFIDFTPEIIEVAVTVDFYELHDRLILATAKWLQVPIISSDEKFGDVKGIKVVWN